MEKLAFAKGIMLSKRDKLNLLETLEPEGIDSFSLEFFYTMLQQRRLLNVFWGYPDLKDNPKLKEALQKR
jgi:hypothetical protein